MKILSRRGGYWISDGKWSDESGIDESGPGASAELEVGRSMLNLKAMLAVLLKIKFTGHLGLEYEKDSDDPISGIAESVGFIRGVTSALEG
ncbi:MAG: hypothetical protein ABSH20_22100 [Tepidisphaeraceae bacterium]